MLLSTRIVLLKSETYKTALVQENFYNNFIGIISTQVAQQLLKQEGLSFRLDSIDKLVKETITPNWLQSNTEKILDNIFLYLQGKISFDELDLSIPIKDLQNQFVISFNLGIKDEISKLPTCTDEQMKQLNEATDKEIVTINCLPLNSSKDEITAQIEKTDTASSLTSKLGEKLDLKTFLAENPTARKYFELLPKFYKILGKIIFYCYLINAFILILISLLLMKKLKVMIRWLGLALFIPAIITLSIILVCRYAIKPILSTFIISLLPAAALPKLIEFVTSIVLVILNKFLLFILWPILAALIIGLILIILAKIFNKKT